VASVHDPEKVGEKKGYQKKKRLPKGLFGGQGGFLKKREGRDRA